MQRLVVLYASSRLVVGSAPMLFGVSTTEPIINRSTRQRTSPRHSDEQAAFDDLLALDRYRSRHNIARAASSWW